MRRLILLLVLIALLLNLSACSQATISMEQSKENFNKYYDSLQAVLAAYDLELTEAIDPYNESDMVSNDFYITIHDTAVIKIYMVNSAYETSYGTESFSIDYIISGGETETKFDVSLFVALVNSISGREISSEICDSFLSAPESEYAAEDYGYKKQEGEIVAKMHPLNFWEDWVFFYSKTDEMEQLTFGGLTKKQ